MCSPCMPCYDRTSRDSGGDGNAFRKATIVCTNGCCVVVHWNLSCFVCRLDFCVWIMQIILPLCRHTCGLRKVPCFLMPVCFHMPYSLRSSNMLHLHRAATNEFLPDRAAVRKIRRAAGDGYVKKHACIKYDMVLMSWNCNETFW